MIHIYGDGGSNPHTDKAAGWAIAVQPNPGKEQWNVFFGFLPPPSSNNVAELTAVINALKLIWKFSNMGERCVPPVKIYSDSEYTLKSVLEWRPKWEYQGMPAKNTDLLLELFSMYDKVCSICELELKWVKGHAGHIGNEIADEWTRHAKRNSDFVVENERLKARKVTGSFDTFIGIV